MSSSDKEFEEQLIEAGNKLLDPPSSVEDLLPLLDKAEYYLSRVEQSPIKPIEDALSPCTKALVAEKLFKHSNADVKVAVASCISEITRITAPDAPYTDEEMKEAFQLIVSSFEHLDDKSSRSYSKRTSILETVAKVRSCVVMLDLECDALILEMFQHFVKTIRDYHAEPVFSSMETIMSLVIEESEDISPELLSPILDTLKKDSEGILPIAKNLGEKVLQNCSTKLKPYLGQALSSLGTCVDDYSEVVGTICQDGSAENKADVTPAVEHEVENEAASPKSEVSNGVKQTAEDESLADTVSMKQPEVVPQRTRLKITGLLSKDKAGKSDTPTDGKKEPGQPVDNGEEKEIKTAPKSKKNSRKRGKKWSSAKKLTKSAGSTPTDGKKEPGQSVDSSEDPSSNLPEPGRENQLTEADVPSDDGKEVDVAPSPKETAIELVDVSSPSKSEEQKKKETLLKESEGPNESEVKDGPGKKPGGGASNEDRTPIKVKISRKGSGITDYIKSSSVKPSSEKVNASSADKDGSSLKTPKDEDNKGTAKGTKVHQKDMTVSLEKDADEDVVPTSKSTRKRHRDEDQPAETPKIKGKKRRTSAKKASRANKYGEELIGTKVKVWWPKDKEFYEGVVDSFDAQQKKHKVLYTDGEIEYLNFKRERWGIIQDYSAPAEEQEVVEESRESSPEMPLKKLLEMKSNKKLSAKKGKATSLKKSAVTISPTSDHKPRAESKNDANLESESGGKAKDNNTPNIGSKLVGLARRMTSKSKGSSGGKKKDTEAEEKEDNEAKENPAAKGRTLKSANKPKKVKSGGSDKKFSSSKTKPKERKAAEKDSGEPSGKVKSSSSKLKSKQTKEVDSDPGEEPSEKVKSSSSKLKSKESKKVDSDSGEEPSDKVKSSASKAKEKTKARDSEETEKDSGDEPSDKVKSSSLKPEESEDVDMDSADSAGDEPSDKVKSTSSKPKQKPKKSKESEDVDMDSGGEPSDKVKLTSLKPKQKTKLKEAEDVDMDSGEKPSDKVKSNSSKAKAKAKVKAKPKPEPEEIEELDDDSGEETEDGLPTKKEKTLAESLKTPASGRKTAGKKRRRGA